MNKGFVLNRWVVVGVSMVASLGCIPPKDPNSPQLITAPYVQQTRAAEPATPNRVEQPDTVATSVPAPSSVAAPSTPTPPDPVVAPTLTAPTPVVAAAPVVAPAAPVVAPAAPVVAPAAPVISPAAPVVSPAAPVVAPAAPLAKRPTSKPATPSHLGWSVPSYNHTGFFAVPKGGSFVYLRSVAEAQKYVKSLSGNSNGTQVPLAVHIPAPKLCEIGAIIDKAPRSELAIVLYRSIEKVDMKCLQKLQPDYLMASVQMGKSATKHKDSFFRIVKGLPSLSGIGYSGPGLNKKKATVEATDIESISHLGLRSISFKDVRIGSKAVGALPANLEVLSLDNVDLLSGGFDLLSRFSSLRVLKLFDSTQEKRSFTGLAKLSFLEQVTVSECGLNDSDAAFLVALSRLRYLDLSSNPLGPDAMVSIAGLHNLNSLRLSNTHVSASSMSRLAALRSLEKLYLNHTSVGDTGMKTVGTLGKLKELDLSDTSVGIEGVKHLRTLGQLRSLVLGSTKVNSKSLAIIAELLELRNLDLTGSPIRRKLETLKPLAKLETLSLESTNIGNRAISKLPLLPKLQRLNLGQMDIRESKISWLESRYPNAEVDWIEPWSD